MAHPRFSIVVLLIALAPLGAARADMPLIVDTTAGPVLGTEAGDMLQWRGVRYGAPPVGSLRWRPTVAPAPWTEVADATQFGTPCLQPDWEGGVYGSEDCLFLNVSAPADVEPDVRLPVFVHIHGGGNFVGAGIENPAAFVRHGVIVVSFNYRLGPLGWMGHPELTAEGGASSNYAMWDQIAVLAWVRDNIAGFGGDPDNVTLGGFSAGAFNTLALAASPVARGLFHRVASQSGARWLVNDTFNTLEDLEAVGVEIGRRMGCPDHDAIECLRDLSADGFTAMLGGFQWFATADGVLLDHVPLEQIEVNGGTVPMLIGGGREEDGWMMFDDRIPDPMSWSEYVHLTAELLGNHAGRARSVYPLADYESGKWAFIIMATDIDKTCPTRQIALATGAPTYKFLYTHALENVEWGPIVKSAHGLEDDMLWGFYGSDWYVMSEGERALSDRMNRYWTNFIKRGDPNEPGLPEWPLFDAASESYLDLGVDTHAVSGGHHVAQCEVIEGATAWPRCGALCRRYLHGELHLPGWVPKRDLGF